MRVTQKGNVLTIALKGTYDNYEVKVKVPEFQVLSFYKETYPGYWVVTSVNELDHNSQDKLFQAIQKVKKHYESQLRSNK